MPGYQASYVANTQKLAQCISCGGNLMTYAADPTKCYSADSQVYKGNSYATCNVDNYIPYLVNSGLISCRPCPYNQFAVAKVTSGVCIQCPHPRQKYQLISGLYECSCTGDTYYVDLQGTNTCVLSSQANIFQNLETDYYVAYNDIEGLGSSISAAKVKSNYFSNYFLQAYYQCSALLSNVYCQQLANMCVLNMYDNNNAICQAFKTIQSNLPSVVNQTFYEYSILSYNLN
jgi:hypothetical protein